MLTLRSTLQQTQTSSIRGLRAVLSSTRSSARQLIQINLLHQHYIGLKGRNGPLGFPDSNVEFAGELGSRKYRGGEVSILHEKVKMGDRLEANIRFLGFKCIRESDSDGLSPHDEPYFVITVDTGNGTPTVKKFGPFEGIDTGDEVGVEELLIQSVAPNPLAVRVMAYENDDGDPDKTAKNIQDEAIKISQEVAKLASAADAADGAGAGPTAGGATIGGIIGGPLGALAAAGVVALLGLGDDFVGQDAAVLFVHSDDVGNPEVQGQFRGADFNKKISVDGDSEGAYDLFFDVRVQTIHPPDDLPP
jgi:hypothetical protein